MSWFPNFKRQPRVRFAPSPTGYLHLGGLRTALYDYLYARQTGGTFILRIEDTDQTRKVEQGTEKIISSLNAIGLEYDEGVFLINGAITQKGDYGPYIQSERLDLYKKYAKELIRKKKAYYCFCAPERLESLRQEQMAKKEPTKYDKKCFHLSSKEIQKKLDAGMISVIRLNIPAVGHTVFSDLVHGEIRFKNNLLDDQVLLKSDGFATYHLANVVDDHLMKITLVIRGEEWLPSTPKHLILYQAFGWKAPRYAHLPLLLNQDKTKLSKRQGDVAVEDYLDKGYLKEAIINFIAFLGWNPGTEQEFWSKEDLVKTFSLDKINQAGAVFNLEKLDWLNAHYLRQLSDQDFMARALPFLLLRYPAAKDQPVKFIQAVLNLEKERLVKLSDVGMETNFFFETPTYDSKILQWKETPLLKTKQILVELVELLKNWPLEKWQAKTFEEELKRWVKEHGWGNGDVFWPLRVALTGKMKSPPPFDCLEILGREEGLKRLNQAIALL